MTGYLVLGPRAPLARSTWVEAAQHGSEDVTARSVSRCVRCSQTIGLRASCRPYTRTCNGFARATACVEEMSLLYLLATLPDTSLGVIPVERYQTRVRLSVGTPVQRQRRLDASGLASRCGTFAFRCRHRCTTLQVFHVGEGANGPASLDLRASTSCECLRRRMLLMVG